MPSAFVEDYLERIDDLIERKGYARTVDIAAALAVRQPSVTAMVKRLSESGYVSYERYRGLKLTEKGRQVARRIKQRHATLARFLALIGVPEAVREQDIEGMEHSLSAETVRSLEALSEVLEANPALLPQIQSSPSSTRRGVDSGARRHGAVRKALPPRTTSVP
ncbi:MAG: transcriptional regulator MntR [Limisphaerales bacterium]